VKKEQVRRRISEKGFTRFDFETQLAPSPLPPYRCHPVTPLHPARRGGREMNLAARQFLIEPARACLEIPRNTTNSNESHLNESHLLISHNSSKSWVHFEFSSRIIERFSQSCGGLASQHSVFHQVKPFRRGHMIDQTGLDRSSSGHS